MAKTKKLKPTTSEKAARYLKVGDVVQATSPKRTEPVRRVQMLISLSDGTDVFFDPDDPITLVDIPEPKEEP